MTWTMPDMIDELAFTCGIQALRDRFDWYDWLEENPVSRPRWMGREL